MAIKEANELIGKLVDRPYGACTFQTVIVDVNTSRVGNGPWYQRVRLEPVAGRGSTGADLDGLCPYEGTIRTGRVGPFLSGLTSVS